MLTRAVPSYLSVRRAAGYALEQVEVHLRRQADCFFDRSFFYAERGPFKITLTAGSHRRESA